MDVFRNCGGRQRNIMAVSGQRVAEGAEPNAACSGTVMRFLESLAAERLAAAQADLAARLVQAKVFKGGMKLLGMLAIAMDGTLRERKRGRGLPAKERNRMVLEAKIVTPQGWSITVMSEHLDPWDDGAGTSRTASTRSRARRRMLPPPRPHLESLIYARVQDIFVKGG